jgi:hypothetical protein
MTSEGLCEIFEGDSADMCTGKFPLMSMGGRVEGLGCADPGARTPIGVSGIPHVLSFEHLSPVWWFGLAEASFQRLRPEQLC